MTNETRICDLTKQLLEILKKGAVWLEDGVVDDYCLTCSEELSKAFDILSELEELLK